MSSRLVHPPHPATRRTTGRRSLLFLLLHHHTVQVYIVVDGGEEVIGDASGTITTFNSKVTISPDHVSLHKGQSEQFSAMVDSRLSDGGTMSYQWTTQGQFGVFPFGETNATTSLPSILYTVTSDQEGSEVVTVEAFSTPKLTPPFPSFQPCGLTTGWGRSGSDGSSYIFFLSGFAGPDGSIGGAVASFQSRFGEMQVEVTVRY